MRCGPSARAPNEGASPPQTPPFPQPRVRVRGSGFHGGETQYADPSGRLAPPWFHPEINLPRRLGQGKGRWSRASIDPYPSLVLSADRRVNSAIRERGLRRSAARNYSAPVVADCSIDPPTRIGRTSFALRLRLRRRSRLAAQPLACANTREPSVATASQAC